MAPKSRYVDARTVAQHAVNSLGRGYDITSDLRFSSCKDVDDGPLVELNYKNRHELVLPGGLIIPDVPTVVKCDKGELTRFRSDVLTFDQMSEQFNQGLSLSGKIPSGLFNNTFSFTGSWQKDASMTKRLALDGWFYTLYTMEIPRSQLVLKEDLKASVPTAWDAAALSSFIEKFGTHIIVGIKVGGKDVVYSKQHQQSTLTAVEFQKLIAEVADERFSRAEGLSNMGPKDNHRNKRHNLDFPSWPVQDSFNQTIFKEKEHVTICPRRKGGYCDQDKAHSDWIQTVPYAPDVISMSFVPITSLLSGVTGCGFLTHAINLYLRYKPQIEELRQFLEFQLPRQWAPVFSDLPLSLSRKERSPPTLQFTLMGPKLKVSNVQVTVGKTPVTGMRLYLEGKKCDKLAIHLQHLSGMPKILQPVWEGHPFAGQLTWQEPEDNNPKFFEPVKWKNFSHICTAPVENTETWIGDHAGAYVVVGAQLAVRRFGIKTVLYLRLLYSKIPEVKIRRSEWDHLPASTQKSGIFSSFISTTFTSSPAPPKPQPVVMNSGIYPEGPPRPVQQPKLLKFVDTAEMTKGPQDMPGHWLVTGAKLYLDNGKISLRVKYSLLTISTD